METTTLVLRIVGSIFCVFNIYASIEDKNTHAGLGWLCGLIGMIH